jgi:hypothetical protein
MSADGRPIGYVPRAENPVLYSVGENGSDEQASEAVPPKQYRWRGEWSRLDRVFYLTAREREPLYVPDPSDPPQPYGPPGPPSTQPGAYFVPLPPWERDKDYEARRKAAPDYGPAMPAAAP